MKAAFLATRKQVDAALALAQKELDAKESQYVKAIKAMDSEIDKFQAANAKGKKGKALDSIVERRYKRTNEAQVGADTAVPAPCCEHAHMRSKALLGCSRSDSCSFARRHHPASFMLTRADTCSMRNDDATGRP